MLPMLMVLALWSQGTNATASHGGPVWRAEADRPSAQLSGRVRLNGQVPVGAKLRIVPRDNSGTAVTLDIGADGRYAATFPQPATCLVALWFDDLPQVQGLRTEVALKEGANIFNWDATGGLYRVSFTGGSSSAQWSLIMEGGGITQTWNTPLPETARIVQPFGTYTFTVAGDVVARAPITVTLDARTPESDVMLELVEHTGTLRLRDDTGERVQKAKVGIPGLGYAAETAPGVYELKNMPLGVPIPVVAPGFAPACSVTTAETTSLALSRGRSVDVVYRQTVSALPAGELLLDAGPPACKVALTRLTFTRQPGAPGEPGRFTIENFPPGDRFTLIINRVKQEIVVPKAGPIVIR